MSWWRDGAIYQVYPRSFQDSDGDGIGDLRGRPPAAALPEWLGVDGVWLSPFYRSPMADFGYDVSDHCDVDPLFGTLEDFDALAADAHRLGLKLILDYVPNHTSIEHPWFRAAARGLPVGATRSRNNWVSVFGGPAWARTRRPLLLPRLSAAAARPELAPRRRPRGDARRPALLVRARRRRLPRRRAASGDQGRPAARQPGQSRVARGRRPLRAVDPRVHDRPPRGAGRDPRLPGEAVGPDRLLLGELYLPLERLVAYYASGLDMPAELPPAHDAVDAARRSPRWWRPTRPPCPRGHGRTGCSATTTGRGWRSRLPPGSERAAAYLLLTLRGTPTLYYGDEIGMRDVAVAPERQADRGRSATATACARRCSGTRAAPSPPAIPGCRSRTTTSASTSPPSATTPARCSRSTAACSRCAAPKATCAPAPTARSPPTTAILRFARGDSIEVTIDFETGDGSLDRTG